MQQSKLGISVTIVGALIYLLGLTHVLGFLLIILFILVYEQNPWLRRCAIKSLLIIILFLLGSTFFQTGDEVFNIINAILTWFSASFILYWPLQLNIICLNALSIMKTIILVLLAIKALKLEDIKLPLIDTLMKQYF